MTNTQLWATKPGSTQKYKLDTYATEPIKLTFTAETLTDIPSINSVYSQTFRLPATGTNNQFFQYWFNVNINDFDVSQKVAAEIVTESGLFIEGQVRLQKVYRNYESTLIDYEVLFLGEVRDFSTQVGDGFLNTLDLTALKHNINYDNIIQSWNAQPGTTNGLLDGNVLYPLVEYGYNYDNDGVVQQNQLQSNGARPFTDSSRGLDVLQWRPWIRAKYLVDTIFAMTDYTYSSAFFESDLFNQLYVNATGNVANGNMEAILPSNDAIVASGTQTWGTVSGVTQYLEWPNEIQDLGNNWILNTYTVPTDGNYNISYDLFGDVTWINIGGGPFTNWPDVDINFYYYINGAPTFMFGANNGGIDPSVYFSDSNTLALVGLSEGDTIQIGYKVEHLNSPPTLLFNTQVFANTLTIDTFALSINNPAQLMSDKVKITDWFRSILTKFRMVMVPDRENPKNFIIEPWNDYISSGKQLDWTHKLDGSKDIQFEPLFFTQSSVIYFTDQEDSDHPNADQQLVYKEVYGTRIYDSNNDLLKDRRDITTVFAPTPNERIEGETTGSFIIPHMGRLEPLSGQLDVDSNVGLIKPIIPKPRLMFYNGLKSASPTWYMKNDVTVDQPKTEYPLLSYMSEFPTTANTINLSWEIEPGRWFLPGPDSTSGKDVYTQYWKDYIDSLYSADARKMTATFVLDSQDLKVEFKDSIFIRDSWWRILKISNAPLDGINAVNVELIKLLNSPGAECSCEQYYVSDLRPGPVEGPFVFSYIDCDTGETAIASVNQTSISLCACQPIVTGDPYVVVTTTGEPCVGPTPEGDVDVDVAVDSSNGGAVLIGLSENGATDWSVLDSQDIPLEPTELTLTGSIPEAQFWRVGYQQGVGVGDVVQVDILRDAAVIYSTTFDATNEMQYVVCPEAMLTQYTYSATITVA